MGFQPWYKTQTYPIIQIPLNAEGVADNITGMTAGNFVMKLRNTTSAPPIDTTGTGTFGIVTSNPAVISYQFSAADVATAWGGSLVVEATFPNPNTGLAVYDPIPFTVSDV
jgi:hypothetical protein